MNIIVPFIVIAFAVFITLAIITCHEPEAPAPKLEPIVTENKPPELSCFVKGIIKSLDTEPDEWICDYNEGKAKYEYKHKSTEIALELTDFMPGAYCSLYLKRDEYKGYMINIDNGRHRMSYDERAAVYDAYIRLVNRNAKIERDKQDILNAPKRSYFEKLGCPN